MKQMIKCNDNANRLIKLIKYYKIDQKIKITKMNILKDPRHRNNNLNFTNKFDIKQIPQKS